MLCSFFPLIVQLGNRWTGEVFAFFYAEQQQPLLQIKR